MENQLNTVIENQNNIFEWMKQNDLKCQQQAELNGKIIMYITLDQK